MAYGTKLGARAASDAELLRLGDEWPPLVTGFAWLGAAILMVGLWSMGAWIFSADFRPTDLGPNPDPIAAWQLMLVRTLEAINVVGCIWLVWFCVRTSRRQGRLSLEAILAIAWGLQYWTDPTIQWIRPMFFYNAYFVNMQNWSGFIPGWVNPTSHHYPSPLLFQGLVYPYYFLVISLLIAWSMRTAKRAFPHWGVLRLIGVAIAVSILWDLMIELIFVRTQMYAYPNAIYALSFWGGETYQFPVYEALAWGFVNASTGILYYFRDDRGNTFAERGIERVKSLRIRSPIRVLAMYGFISIPFWIYIVVMVLFSLHGDPMPEGMPSWLVNGACGEGTIAPCPGPTTVIPPFVNR